MSGALVGGRTACLPTLNMLVRSTALESFVQAQSELIVRRLEQRMVEAISRDGYIIAQAYVPAAKKGDIRLFLMNGRPLEVDGKYAALRRVAAATYHQVWWPAHDEPAYPDRPEAQMILVGVEYLSLVTP